MQIRQIGQFIRQTVILLALQVVIENEDLDLFLHFIALLLGTIARLLHQLDLRQQVMMFMSDLKERSGRDQLRRSSLTMVLRLDGLKLT